MSSFVVSYEHINAIAAFIHKQTNSTIYVGGYIESCRSETAMQKVGLELWAANTKAVNYDYGKNESMPEFRFQPSIARALKPLEVIKACQCLEYQSCELPNWEKTEAYRIIQDIKDIAIRQHMEELKSFVPGTKPNFGHLDLWEVAA